MYENLLEFNHVGYNKYIIMNTHIVESLHHNNILEPIIRSKFKSSNIYLAIVEPSYKHNRFT
jgi:hypothetical protein